MSLIEVARTLRREVAGLQFAPPVTHVYNPLDYAWAPHRAYLERYGRDGRDVVLVGMNPGPWGMVQTGVPFGDVPFVRDWMGIEAPVGQPACPHPKRPVQGFACGRREGSGRRLWSWAQQVYGSADEFFARFFVLNYCPLCFFEADGRNRTPDKLPVSERRRLFGPCDRALARSIDCLAPAYVLGIGRFATSRVTEALRGRDVTFGAIPHPSPASPLANQGWDAQVERALESLGLRLA